MAGSLRRRENTVNFIGRWWFWQIGGYCVGCNKPTGMFLVGIVEEGRLCDLL